MNVLEAMETCVAMRYLKPDPVPRPVLETLIHAATRASSPGNSQGWAFVVIDDAGIKADVGAAVSRAMAPALAGRSPDRSTVEGRMLGGAAHLVEHFAEVPAWILVGARKIYPPQQPLDIFLYSTVYPAMQNLIVAARSLGLGTTFTTFQMAAEAELRAATGVPDDLHLCGMVAVGYPARPFTPVKRKPVAEVLHWNRWEG